MRSSLNLGSLSALMVLGLTVGGCVGNQGIDSEDDEASVGTDALGACAANLAVAKISASGAQTGYPATQAVDGNLATRWSNLGVGSALTADLGVTKSVCSVGIAWYKGTTRTSNFTIGISTDGTSFTTVFSGKSSGKSEAVEQTAISAAQARYVRVTVNGNTESDWASIDELAISGSTGFVHPGVLMSKAQLDLIKTKVNAKAEPWNRAYAEMAASKYGRGTWAPSPFATVACESTGGAMSGCTEELDDARAAIAHAIQYYVTGDNAQADNAIAILNAWSHKLVSHTGSNAPLQAGWAAENFTRAAEIIRHTSTRWAAADIAKFSTMLTSVYLPLIENGWKWGNGNWDLTMIDGTMAIAVFTDDRATFDHAVSLWKVRVPEYIYLTTDGEFPVRPSTASTNDEILSLWIWPSTKISGVSHPKYPFVNGLAQETCRDFNHVSLGTTSMSDAAETAWIQGQDLYSYSDFETRISKAIEFQSTYLNGTTLPSWLCGGEAAHRGSGSNPTVGFFSKSPYSVALNYEVAYNHYANRLGMNLPQTKQAISTIDSNGSDYRNKVGPTASWENFTNAEK